MDHVILVGDIVGRGGKITSALLLCFFFFFFFDSLDFLPLFLFFTFSFSFSFSTFDLLGFGGFPIYYNISKYSI